MAVAHSSLATRPVSVATPFAARFQLVHATRDARAYRRVYNAPTMRFAHVQTTHNMLHLNNKSTHAEAVGKESTCAVGASRAAQAWLVLMIAAHAFASEYEDADNGGGRSARG